MISIAVILITTAVAVPLYAYGVYPLLLRVIASARDHGDTGQPTIWPSITFSIPAYNEEAQIADTLRAVLACDYPADLRQVIVGSDASTDRTDDVVRSFASQGVELARQQVRSGKTELERLIASRAHGEIIINMDASIRIPNGAVQALVRQFVDASVGVASGCDVSVSQVEQSSNNAEAGYVGYEMGIRQLETRVSGIVGASGCFYAIRRDLHALPLPASLSRDFASALHAREHGYRAVSVDSAVCYVPRTPSMNSEYRRKVRTIERGMHTLWYKRHLLDPTRYGTFAWMLLSHKAMRWLVPWTSVLGLLGIALLALQHSWAATVLVGVGLGCLVAWGGWAAPASNPKFAPLRIVTYLAMSNLAVLHATLRLIRGEREAVWEPTRRHQALVG